MTYAELPRNARIILDALASCIDDAKLVRSTKHRDFNAEERKEWAWIFAAFETRRIACTIAELDRDTYDLIISRMGEVSGLISVEEVKKRRSGPKKKRRRKAVQVERLTLFNGAEDAA